MRKRLIELPQKRSFFLFGARNTGKSTLVKSKFPSNQTLIIDLLHAEEESRYLRNPELLREEIIALPEEISHVVIDEIQKVPALLDEVHSLIETTDKIFVLTGSSARKLKKGAANLLAGRAFVKNLFPFSFLEVGQDFDINQALNWGMLPEIFVLESKNDKSDFLRAYAHTYLKEEVWAEHLIRKLEPFQYFLEVAAQCNGTTINLSKIAKDVGVNDKSISEYFSILVDTLVGFTLPAFKHSFRKRLIQKPKFYYFDCGVVKALKKTLTLDLQPSTYDYGNAFEHFIITEIMKCAAYYYPDYQFSYLRTKDDVEIDLVVERPGLPILMIEIKSADNVTADHLTHLKNIAADFPDSAEFVCLANIPRKRQHDKITLYPWRQGIKALFTAC